MKNKKQFTLIELIIVIVVIGILAAMALPKFNGVVRDAKLSAMINDKEVLEKTLIMYYQKNDELPLLNEDEELIIANEGTGLTKIVLAEEVETSDMDTIYKSLKETLTYYSDSEDSLYRIDLSKIKDNLSKDIKYGHKKHDKDFYVYSTKTGNVYYYNYLVNGNDTIQHSEYDTLLKETELTTKIISPSLNNNSIENEDNISIQKNTMDLGSDHSIKIGEDGNLYTWGSNGNGQLGIGNLDSQGKPQLVNLPNDEKPISVYAKGNRSIIITNKGNLYGCGYSLNGELGTGIAIGRQTTFININLPNEEKAVSVALGEYHSMCLTDKGNLYAWGKNEQGQLGIGNTENQLTPQLVTLPNKEKPVSIFLGKHHSMAITNKGNLYAWGWNEKGQLGINSSINQSTPQLVTLPNEEKPNLIALGWAHSIIVTDKGNLYTCGSNVYRELGIGNTISQKTFQKVTFPDNETPIYIESQNYDSIAITKKGDVYSWGGNSDGQLGLKFTKNQPTPKLIEYFENIKISKVFLGDSHCFFMDDNNKFYAVGKNNNGQLTLNYAQIMDITEATLP